LAFVGFLCRRAWLFLAFARTRRRTCTMTRRARAGRTRRSSAARFGRCASATGQLGLKLYSCYVPFQERPLEHVPDRPVRAQPGASRRRLSRRHARTACRVNSPPPIRLNIS
jgi:hypothetical protein